MLRLKSLANLSVSGDVRPSQKRPLLRPDRDPTLNVDSTAYRVRRPRQIYRFVSNMELFKHIETYFNIYIYILSIILLPPPPPSPPSNPLPPLTDDKASSYDDNNNENEKKALQNWKDIAGYLNTLYHET